MKKIVFLFAIIAVFSFTASAQFSFTNNSGKKFSVSSAPQKTDPRGGGFVMEFYYTVEGSDLVVYEVGKTNGVVGNSIAVTKVAIDTIKSDRFKVRESDFGGCYLQTGTAFTKITHGADYNATDKYSNSNLQLDFKSCDAANELRTKVLGEDLGLDELDLSLEDKPKEKSKMPAHLFALIGEGSRGFYQFNRKTMEVWDYKPRDIFKVGKINDLGEELQMLDETDSYFTYKIKDSKLYNGDKSLGYSIVAATSSGFVICRSLGNGTCNSKYAVDRDAEMVFGIDSNGKRYENYKIMGEASDEEILLILALLEKL